MRSVFFRFLKVFICGACLNSGATWSGENDSDLTIYFEENYPPYTFTVNGKVDGINAVMIIKACEVARLYCDFVEMPWSRAMATVLKDPKGGVLSASRNASREPFFKWVGPVMSGETMYFKLKSRQDIVINKSADVFNYTIGVTRNDIYESVLLARGFELGENLLQTTSKTDPMRLFLVGKLDLMFASAFTLPSVLEQFGKTINDVEAVAWLRTPELKGNYLAVNTNVPNHIVDQLNKALKDYRKTADFNQLINRFRPSEITTPTF